MFAFIPFALTFLHRVHRIMHNNVISLRSTYVIFKKTGYVIQKIILVIYFSSIDVDVRMESNC
jgi:hypothetical protein